MLGESIRHQKGVSHQKYRVPTSFSWIALSVRVQSSVIRAHVEHG